MIEGIKPLYNAVLRPLGLLLVRLRIHPNALTILGVVFFGIAGAEAAGGSWSASIAWAVAGAFLDGLDGLVAREAGKRSLFGAVLDSSCDRLTEILWIGGIAVHFLSIPSLRTVGVAAAFACVTGSLMVSYVKARAESAGIECRAGLLQRPERIIAVAALLFFSPTVMAWGLGALAALAYLTVIQRLWVAYRAARGKVPGASVADPSAPL